MAKAATASAETEEFIELDASAEDGKDTLELVDDKPEPEKTEPEKAEVAKTEEPEKPALAAPALKESPPAEPKSGDLTVALRVEREKRRKIQADWKRIQEEKERLEGRLQAARPAVTVPKLSVPSFDEARIQRVIAAADKLDGFGPHAELLLKEVNDLLRTRDEETNKYLQQQHDTYSHQLYQLKLSILEDLERRSHADFNETLAKAGIWSALEILPNGSYRDPILAKEIYSNTNPPHRAYELAEAALTQTADDEPPAEGKAADAAPEKLAPAEATAEAERRGAREVIQRVEAANLKPRGITHLRDGGAPKMRFTKAELDTMMDQNPTKYEALIKQFPQLERWHLG